MRETTEMMVAGMQDMSMDKTGFLVKAHTTIVGMRKGGDGAYYKGFIDGCMSVEGNTKYVCESASD